jgi:site-specific recombinase XerC
VAIGRAKDLDPTFIRLTPHDLRHTAASLAVFAGGNVKAIQRMLGHTSAAMTLDVYADLFDDDLDTLADALDVARSNSQVKRGLQKAINSAGITHAVARWPRAKVSSGVRPMGRSRIKR